jgi:hypothetical protein
MEIRHKSKQISPSLITVVGSDDEDEAFETEADKDAEGGAAKVKSQQV